ncbi:hypothetical protein HY969_03740 [Candidatus Kaiserbacteria bacterium]|nr:hypothetical protein [Candidatus Kaiserbacteria bacterium]
MMEMLAKNKIVVGGIAIFVLVGAWYGLSGNTEAPELLVTEDFTVPSSEADKDLVTTLLQLRSVSLEGTIFSDPLFQTLVDHGSDIIPEPVGRPNPFAPLLFGQFASGTPASVGR